MQLLKVLAAKPLQLEYDAFTEIHKDFLINDNLNNIPLESTSSSGKEILFLLELEVSIYVIFDIPTIFFYLLHLVGSDM